MHAIICRVIEHHGQEPSFAFCTKHTGLFCRPFHNKSNRHAEFSIESAHPASPSRHVEGRHMEEGLPEEGGAGEQPAARAGFMHPRLDFSVTYSMAERGSSEGIVPAITVGNVYAAAREECVIAILSFRSCKFSGN